MMANLKIIEKLRENRERSALVSLRAATATRDDAATTASVFEGYLQSQRQAQLANERQLYQETLGKTLAAQDLEAVHSRVQRESSEIEVLAQQDVELKAKAAQAASAAEEARLRHARLLRAQKKWARLREHHDEINSIEEIYREELALDDLKLPNYSF